MRRGATTSSSLYPVVGYTRKQSFCSWDSNPPRTFLHLSHTCTQAQSAAATVVAACASVRQRLAATVVAAWGCRHSPDGAVVLDTPSSRNPFKNVQVILKFDMRRNTLISTLSGTNRIARDARSHLFVPSMKQRNDICSFYCHDHWETFIVEKDFKFIADSGLNAVRIPVGWWTANDPSPPKPFVGGSLQYLDKAFLWAEKYNLKVILDLHAAPGSQNGFEHSATRDGLIEWGITDENIQETVRVIEFFTTRYAAFPSLYAVELINEPHASGVPVSVLNKYYDAGYKAVRKHAPNAFVILATRLSGDAKEFFPLAKGMQKVVIDVHYYNLFSDIFNDMTVEQNINFIQTNRSNDLQDITTSDGPLTFVGYSIDTF
ncbi:probable glucan 1,3-beta-glucosidase A [Tanacetum coccineum]